MRKKVFLQKLTLLAAVGSLLAGGGGRPEAGGTGKRAGKGGERCCFCDLSGIGQEQLEGIGIQRTSRHP